LNWKDWRTWIGYNPNVRYKCLHLML
jgi:hypothetical protein